MDGWFCALSQYTAQGSNMNMSWATFCELLTDWYSFFFFWFATADSRTLNRNETRDNTIRITK